MKVPILGNEVFQQNQLYYPKPRPAASSGVNGFAQSRITFRPHFHFDEANLIATKNRKHFEPLAAALGKPLVVAQTDRCTSVQPPAG